MSRAMIRRGAALMAVAALHAIYSIGIGFSY
jgi:hypothetical protein